MSLYVSQLSVNASCPSDTSVTLLQVRRGLEAGGILRVVQWGVDFDSANVTSNTTPARVALIEQTTGGTMTQVGGGRKYDSGDSTSQASWRWNATAEPTFQEPYEIHHVPVTGGPLVIQYPLGREPKIRHGERIGIVVRAQAGSAASAIAHLIWEE